MKKMVAAAGLLLVFALTNSGFAQVDRSEEAARLLNALRTGSSTQRIQTAKLITQSGIEDRALYETVAALLKAGYAKGTDADHVDEMSWLCKALSASGDPRYKALLSEVAQQSPSSKLTHYAEQSIDMIEEYARRTAILKSTATWQADLSADENRLLNMLNSGNIQLKRDAAKRVVRSIKVHDKVYEVVATQLLAMLAGSNSASEHIDTMAWMCKALAASGYSKYGETLQRVKDGTESPKLQKYASKALKQLD